MNPKKVTYRGNFRILSGQCIKTERLKGRLKDKPESNILPIDNSFSIRCLKTIAFFHWLVQFSEQEVLI